MSCIFLQDLISLKLSAFQQNCFRIITRILLPSLQKIIRVIIIVFIITSIITDIIKNNPLHNTISKVYLIFYIIHNRRNVFFNNLIFYLRYEICATESDLIENVCVPEALPLNNNSDTFTKSPENDSSSNYYSIIIFIIINII